MPYVTSALRDTPGPVVAVSDYMRAVPDQIRPFVRHTWCSLGTDGFGFADTRPAARRFFLVDAQSIVTATLEVMARDGMVDPQLAVQAFEKYELDDPTAVARGGAGGRRHLRPVSQARHQSSSFRTGQVLTIRSGSMPSASARSAP